MKIKEMTEDSRPRERLVKFGIQTLTDSEILALIFGSGSKKENVIEMSNKLINKYGLANLSKCSLSELQQIEGIGLAKATKLLALFEFSKRHNLACNPNKKITCARDVFNLLQEKLRDETQEKFIVLSLDGRCRLLKEEIISLGILDASIVHPREVFKGAIKESAFSVVLVHNHPSGDASPSREDLKIVKILKKSGDILGIPVLDQIIIGKEDYWSWKESIN